MFSYHVRPCNVFVFDYWLDTKKVEDQYKNDSGKNLPESLLIIRRYFWQHAGERPPGHWQ